MLRNKIPVFLILFWVLSFSLESSVWAWPFGKKKEETKSSSTAKKTALSQSKTAQPKTIARISAQDENFFDEDAEPVDLPTVPKVPQVDLPQLSPKLIKLPAEAGLAPNLPSASVKEIGLNDPEILKIQKQIQEIIKINEDLKSNYADQAAQIQKISEQAKIHEKILKDLEATKKLARPAAENYLDLEKVHLIQRETEENRKFLASIQNQKPSQGQTPASSGVPNPKNS